MISYNLPQIGAAVQNYLKAVGINVRIQQFQIGAVIKKAEAGKAPMYAVVGQQLRQRCFGVHALFPRRRSKRLRA